MDAYQKGPIIGEGTYGSVICATHKASGRRVAIKKVRMASNREGVNMSVLRELKALQALQAPHVVELLDVFTTKSSLVLVFEYMDCSLDDVIRDKGMQLSTADVKAYMQMMLQGLAHVHGEGVVHRDVKPDNMLIGSNNALKLADFGLARSLDAPCSSPSEPSKLTPQVFGRWYRPPELLMGCCHYGCPVDMWAAGCVLAELLLRRPWFPGVCDMDQLDRIFKALGVPTVQTWPGMADLPHRIDFKPAEGQPLQQLFPQASAECLDLLQQLMQFDPQRRISSAAALQHPYFSSSPAPTTVEQLPRPTSSRGRRDVTVPAIMQDLLMRPAMMMRQQDAPAGFCGGGGGSSSSRQLFAFSGQHSSFSGRLTSGQGLQAGWPSAAGAAAGLQGAEGMLSSGSRLIRSLSFGSTPGVGSAGSAEQHEQLCNVLEEGPAMPWKGRLSFGSVADEPAGVSAGDGQQQQHRRPSPAAQQQQQQHQQGSKGGSMRPPLHRNPAAAGQQQHSGATPITAHVSSLGVAGGGSGDSHAPDAAAAGGTAAPGNRRRVSDLAASLSSAVAGASGGLLGSVLAPSQQGAAALLQDPTAAGQGNFVHHQPSQTPAAVLAVPRCGNAAAAAAHGGDRDTTADDADMACPMSLGTSALKRSRAVFESAAAAAAALSGGMQQQDGSVVGHMQQLQQQGHGAAMSVSGGFRRVVRGRRSSMGSGCCSMEMDCGPTSVMASGLQQQQQVQAGAAGSDVAHGDGSIGGQLNQIAGRAADKQHELEALLGGSQQQQQQNDRLQQQGHLEQQQQQFHQQQLGQQGGVYGSDGSVLLQAVHPWQGVHGDAAAGMHSAANAVAAAAADSDVQQQQQPADSGECPMSLDQRATTVGRRFSMHSVQGQQQQQHVQQQPPQHGQQQQQQCGHHATGLIAPGAAAGASSDCMKGTGCGLGSAQASGGAAGSGGFVSGPGFNTGGDGGLGFGGLAAMDPADLAELAAWWRPRLDSAERRYLRCRKQQMDEALLQASQQDDDEARDNTLGSPEFHPRSALFSSPLGDTPEAAAAAAAAADGVGASAQPAAAAAGAATGYDSRRGY